VAAPVAPGGGFRNGSGHMDPIRPGGPRATRGNPVAARADRRDPAAEDAPRAGRTRLARAVGVR
jgi:hypothetical protein